MFLKLVIQAKKFDNTKFDEQIKQLAARIYEHSFKRTNIPLVPLITIADPFAIMGNSKLVRYLGFFNAIKEGLDSIFSSPESLSNDTSQAATDISMIQLLQLFAQQLHKFHRG